MKYTLSYLLEESTYSCGARYLVLGVPTIVYQQLSETHIKQVFRQCLISENPVTLLLAVSNINIICLIVYSL